MKRGSGPALVSVLASASTLLLRKRQHQSSLRVQQAVASFNTEAHRQELLALIERTRTEALIALLRIKLGFPREVFEHAVMPVIAGYAELVQRLPMPGLATANPDERFARGLHIAGRALDYRRGQLLPRGASPEVIGAQAHRWTYAVLVAALVRGAGKNGADPSKAPASLLLERFVPRSVLEWLAEDSALMRELLAFLSDAKSAQDGAIAELVFRAATESVGHNLLSRSRCDATPKESSPCKTSAETNEGAEASTVSESESTLANEEPEYLQDVEENDHAPDQIAARREALMESAPDAARRFMGWVRRGLSEGTLLVNRAGALVHFVDEGMLLVSPRIFREFANYCGGDVDTVPDHARGEPDVGKSIQREVLRAGWHLRADKGINILTYQVIRRNRPPSRLSGVVITHPGRFVTSIPPVNPLLVRARDDTQHT